ncbi:hypothetical protein BC332_23145 [Capsicum chinense]|nr:hypothetical protein BC332_23145 [Capsicum chinense]
MPTEPNIADCIKYGDSKHRNTDIKKAFTSAVEQQLVVMQTLGALQLYVEKNKNLWRCVNPIDGNLKQYPKEAWDDLQNFLSSSAGRHSATQKWEEDAHEPLNYGIDCLAICELGPGMAFANEILTKDPNCGVIGLVPCSRGGTGMYRWICGSYAL